MWPIAPPHPITQGYKAPATRYSAGHRGIDISAQPGSAVFAPADGIIHFTGVVVDRPVLTLEIAGDLLATSEPVESSLAVGTAVHAGDAIGIVASGGHCSACLHFGVRLNGEYVSPLLYLSGVERAILLPMR
jgi:murein DD-endopeptidase MepM/ murein hydrolase activator NlpD